MSSLQAVLFLKCTCGELKGPIHSSAHNLFFEHVLMLLQNTRHGIQRYEVCLYGNLDKPPTNDQRYGHFDGIYGHRAPCNAHTSQTSSPALLLCYCPPSPSGYCACLHNSWPIIGTTIMPHGHTPTHMSSRPGNQKQQATNRDFLSTVANMYYDVLFPAETSSNLSLQDLRLQNTQCSRTFPAELI